MGIPTVTAARILKGQLSGQSGEETQLEMDKFPYVALAKVFHHCDITERRVAHFWYKCPLYACYHLAVMTVSWGQSITWLLLVCRLMSCMQKVLGSGTSA